LVSGGNFVQSKNYYLLTLLQENSAARKLIESDTILVALAKRQQEQLSMALKECGSDASCFTGRMKFSGDDIAAQPRSAVFRQPTCRRHLPHRSIPAGRGILHAGTSFPNGRVKPQHVI